MMEHEERAREIAKQLLRELNDAMKSPRGDYYQGDIEDPHRALHIVERHVAAALAAQAAQTRKLACPTHEPILRDSVEAKSCCALGFTVSFWDRKYCEVADELEREAAQTRALRDAADLVLNSERDDDGEGSWYCVLASDMAQLRAALTGAPREPQEEK